MQGTRDMLVRLFVRLESCMEITCQPSGEVEEIKFRAEKRNIYTRRRVGREVILTRGCIPLSYTYLQTP